MTPLLMLITILVLLAVGVPIAFALGVTALVFLIFFTDLQLNIIVQQLFQGVYSFPLLAIPLFIFAGSLMNQAGMYKKLVNLSLALVGMIKGGLAVVNVMTSTFCGAIAGTAAAASSAVGQVLIPEMNEDACPAGLSAATASAGYSLGILFPPSVPMILYGSIAGISVADLFLTGIPIGI